MNELSTSSTNCLMLSNNIGFETQNNKRSLNTSEYYERKRVCNNQHNFDSHFNNNNNSLNHNNHDDYDDYVELTQFDRLLMNISNKLINFNINFVDIPEWPVFLNESIDPINNNDNKSHHKTQDLLTEDITPTNGPKFPPKVGQIFFKYCLDSLVKSEKRVAVFVGHKSDKTDEELIIKIGIESGVRLLEIETNNYRALKGGKAVPKLIDFIQWKVYNDNYTVQNWAVVVIEKLGSNLVELMKKSVTLPMEMVFDFAVQMIDIIEYIHSKGLIHRALKPENFLIGHDSSLKLYIIGLSSSKSYLIKKTDGTVEHIEYQRDQKLPKGDPNYHSIGYHNGIRRSRRDDLESIGYCIVYLIKGSLPWIDVQHKHNNIRRIGKRMQSTTIEELCEGLPQHFSLYFQLISGLLFKDQPNYEALRQCFRNNSLN